MDEIKDFVESKSNGTITCEEQSLYRVLRKYEHIDVLKYELRKGNKGPARKYYYLTDLGKKTFRSVCIQKYTLVLFRRNQKTFKTLIMKTITPYLIRFSF